MLLIIGYEITKIDELLTMFGRQEQEMVYESYVRLCQCFSGLDKPQILRNF
jgi:hypothetical protein